MIQIDIPMPTDCRDCPCAYFTEGAYKDICQITKGILIDEKDEFGLSTFNYPKPKWCPLSELEEIPNPCIECSQNCCVCELNGEKCECQKVYVVKENRNEDNRFKLLKE